MTYSKFKDIIKIINEDSPIRNMGNTNLGFKEKCENDLRDLKYLIVDSFFLLIDLENFYKYKEFERFKMRAVNHINKRRRASFAQYFSK